MFVVCSLKWFAHIGYSSATIHVMIAARVNESIRWRHCSWSSPIKPLPSELITLRRVTTMKPAGNTCNSNNATTITTADHCCNEAIKYCRIKPQLLAVHCFCFYKCGLTAEPRRDHCQPTIQLLMFDNHRVRLLLTKHDEWSKNGLSNVDVMKD